MADHSICRAAMFGTERCPHKQCSTSLFSKQMQQICYLYLYSYIKHLHIYIGHIVKSLDFIALDTKYWTKSYLQTNDARAFLWSNITFLFFIIFYQLLSRAFSVNVWSKLTSHSYVLAELPLVNFIIYIYTYTLLFRVYVWGHYDLFI